MTVPPYSILIVDDEQGNVESLGRIFQREGFQIHTAFDGREGLDVFRQHPTDIVLCDVMMPQLDGLDLLKALKTVSPHTQVIMMTAYGSIDRAVEAMRRGAYDFVTKPLKRQDIVKLIQKALETSALLQENQSLRQQLKELETPGEIIGRSQALQRTMTMVRQVAPSNATILIQGPSGTGKELIAREIHRISSRSHKKFVAINCSAFPETLFDSELFGYERGAFTGATHAKPGRFEMADGGTLFLDEIGELSLPMQVKLLRVLQERQIERLGGTDPRSINIRLIAATNRDLSQEVEKGNFRGDLFYRLNVVPIWVPPLRERSEDIPLLAQHFLQKYANELGKPTLQLPPETIALLGNYAWPGNVRELENAMERAVVLAVGPLLLPSDLPPEIHQSPSHGNCFVIPFGMPLDKIERLVIHETLKRTHGDKRLTAQLLGIATRTIYRKMDTLQHNEDSFSSEEDDEHTPLDEQDPDAPPFASSPVAHAPFSHDPSTQPPESLSPPSLSLQQETNDLPR